MNRNIQEWSTLEISVSCLIGNEPKNVTEPFLKGEDLSESQPCPPQMSPHYKYQQVERVQEGAGADRAGTDFQTLGSGRSGAVVRYRRRPKGTRSIAFPFLGSHRVSQTQEDPAPFLPVSPTSWYSFP